jgi:hypothetical protein
MGMEFWLIPVVAIGVAGVAILYLVIRRHGGSGVRGDGTTAVDKPVIEETRHFGWNYYKK